jgi:hypothetical protein
MKMFINSFSSYQKMKLEKLAKKPFLLAPLLIILATGCAAKKRVNISQSRPDQIKKETEVTLPSSNTVQSRDILLPSYDPNIDRKKDIVLPEFEGLQNTYCERLKDYFVKGEWDVFFAGIYHLTKENPEKPPEWWYWHSHHKRESGAKEICDKYNALVLVEWEKYKQSKRAK